ncbi:MAG: class I SAM-dependent methyltransferase [Oscillospiraceae bacterium]|jgi:ubiquinone/menaquinone biosynthesis C-methylase UbiE|nr:class I SAM-dependent methyltransferase [Oscillospiraceae bacterium]
MNKLFAEMFSRQPDEITDGDYFYRQPEFDAWIAEGLKEAETSGVSIKVNPIQLDTWLGCWEETSLDCEKTSLSYEPAITKSDKAVEIINKIASEGKPFMDIASSDTMGLATYIVKLNPGIPALVTDISADLVKILRGFINERLTEYNINLAVFDNLKMPVKDNSLDYVTSRYGIVSSAGIMPANEAEANIYNRSADRKKSIGEAYRVLKPGGRFVTLETSRECDFDLRKVYDYCNTNGKLFGVYTYGEMQAVLDALTETSWLNEFTAAGFEVEVEEKHYEKYSFAETMNFLYGFTAEHGIRRWGKGTWREQLKPENWVYNIEAERAENAAVDFYRIDGFYILRKPD